MADAWLMKSEEQTDKTTQNCTFEDSFEPFEKLPDSDNYISALENKLKKLKGHESDPKPSNLIRNLEAVRDQHLRNLILQNDRLETSETVTENGTRMNIPTVLRRLYPEKQALSDEELQKLLLADELARIAAQLQAIENEKSEK